MAIQGAGDISPAALAALMARREAEAMECLHTGDYVASRSFSNRAEDMKPLSAADLDTLARAVRQPLPAPAPQVIRWSEVGDFTDWSPRAGDGARQTVHGRFDPAEHTMTELRYERSYYQFRCSCGWLSEPGFGSRALDVLIKEDIAFHKAGMRKIVEASEQKSRARLGAKLGCPIMVLVDDPVVARARHPLLIEDMVKEQVNAEAETLSEPDILAITRTVARGS